MIIQNKGNKENIFKNCVPFTDCMNNINNTQVDNANDLDVVIPMYNSIEYSNIYSKPARSSCQYYRWAR